MFFLTEWEILNNPLAHIASGRFIVTATTAWWHRLLKRWTRFWQFYSFPEVRAIHSSLTQLSCTVFFWPFIIWFGITAWSAVYRQWWRHFSGFPHKFLTAEQCWTVLLGEMAFTFICSLALVRSELCYISGCADRQRWSSFMHCGWAQGSFVAIPNLTVVPLIWFWPSRVGFLSLQDLLSSGDIWSGCCRVSWVSLSSIPVSWLTLHSTYCWSVGNEGVFEVVLA